MFCDTNPFNALFGIELHSYMVERSEELTVAVEQARSDGCQAVVGGDIVCAYAQAIGMPNRFIPSGIESLRTALETASRVCYAIDLEKRNSAEMDTMLNYTFTGIMRVDRNGFVLRVNRIGYDLLNRAPSEVLGRKATELLPGLTQKSLEGALLQGEETYAVRCCFRHDGTAPKHTVESEQLHRPHLRYPRCGIRLPPFQRGNRASGRWTSHRICLPSPFDYKANCLLYLPLHPPELMSSGYFDELAAEIAALLDACWAHALALFTSYAAMSAIKSLSQNKQGRDIIWGR